MSEAPTPGWRGTTILAVKKGERTVIAGDGQVSMGATIVKANARKVRRLAGGKVVAGFAGATADAFTLLERLEQKLEAHPEQFARACVELAKDWRTDRYLRLGHDEATSVITGGRRAGARGGRRHHRLGRSLRACGGGR